VYGREVTKNNQRRLQNCKKLSIGARILSHLESHYDKTINANQQMKLKSALTLAFCRATVARLSLLENDRNATFAPVFPPVLSLVNDTELTRTVRFI
jgi:hypothetical protein